MVSVRRSRTWPSPEGAPWHPERCSRLSTWIITVTHADTHWRGYLGSLLYSKLTEILVFGFPSPLHPPTLHNPQSGQPPSFLLFLSHRALDSGSCDEPVVTIARWRFKASTTYPYSTFARSWAALRNSSLKNFPRNLTFSNRCLKLQLHL